MSPSTARPAQQVRGFRRQPLEAFAHKLAQRRRHVARALGRARRLESEERVAAAVRVDARGVHAGRDGPYQFLGFRGAERAHLDLHHQLLAAQGAQRPRHRRVVGELAAACRERDQHRAVAVHARHVVQQRGRGAVAPVHVVKHQEDGRGAVGARGQQLGDGAEEPLAARALVAAAPELGQEKGEIAAERRTDGETVEMAQRIDPRPVRSIRFDLVAASVEHGAAPAANRIHQLRQQAALADSGLAGEQRHPLLSIRDHGIEQLVQAAHLAQATDERRGRGGFAIPIFAVACSCRWCIGTGQRGGPALSLVSAFEGTGERSAQLLEHPPPAPILLLGLAGAAGGAEETAREWRAAPRPGTRPARGRGRAAAPPRAGRRVVR